MKKIFVVAENSKSQKRRWKEDDSSFVDAKTAKMAFWHCLRNQIVAMYRFIYICTEWFIDWPRKCDMTSLGEARNAILLFVFVVCVILWVPNFPATYRIKKNFAAERKLMSAVQNVNYVNHVADSAENIVHRDWQALWISRVNNLDRSDLVVKTAGFTKFG